jgi:hypothetical protein
MISVGFFKNKILVISMKLKKEFKKLIVIFLNLSLNKKTKVKVSIPHCRRKDYVAEHVRWQMTGDIKISFYFFVKL